MLQGLYSVSDSWNASKAGCVRSLNASDCVFLSLHLIDHLVIPYNWEFVYPHVIIVIFLDVSSVCLMGLKPDHGGNNNHFRFPI